MDKKLNEKEFYKHFNLKNTRKITLRFGDVGILIEFITERLPFTYIGNV